MFLKITNNKRHASRERKLEHFFSVCMWNAGLENLALRGNNEIKRDRGEERMTSIASLYNKKTKLNKKYKGLGIVEKS